VFRPLTSIRMRPPLVSAAPEACSWRVSSIESRFCARKASPSAQPDRAKVSAMTRRQPPDRNAQAQAPSVAPVVTTSSTNNAAGGGRPARRTRGGEASRSARGRPTWRRPCERRRQGLTGRPVSIASAAAISSAASNPLRRRRAGAGGTGTITPCSKWAGARSAITAPADLASRSRAANFSATTRSRATPSYGAADQASSRPGTGVEHGAGPRSADSHRSQRCSRGPHFRAHTAQRGGATRPRSSASMRGDHRRSRRTGRAHTVANRAPEST
jgi:hypothetical protein